LVRRGRVTLLSVHNRGETLVLGGGGGTRPNVTESLWYFQEGRDGKPGKESTGIQKVLKERRGFKKSEKSCEAPRLITQRPLKG